ncbi:hypothetical protein Hanom_Chr12g01075301 [Helianthus anomalus]
MSSSSNSPSSVSRNPKIFKVDLERNVYCFELLNKKVFDKVNIFTIALIGRSDCKFFLWKEDVHNMFKQHSSHCKFSYEDLKFQNMELLYMVLVEEKKMLKAKICGTESK